jgi:hypothetical protein
MQLLEPFSLNVELFAPVAFRKSEQCVYLLKRVRGQRFWHSLKKLLYFGIGPADKLANPMAKGKR